MPALVRAQRSKWFPFENEKDTREWSLLDGLWIYRIEKYTNGWRWSIIANGMLHFESYPLQSPEQCEAACQSDFDARWLAMTEVPELVWEYADFGFWYASDDQYCIAAVGDEFQAWFRNKKRNANFGTRPSLDAAKSVCNAHNRRMILGSESEVKNG